MLLIVVMKFQDKFASLQQLHSPNWQDKFQICCIDMYVIRFLTFWSIQRVFVNFTAPQPHQISEALYFYYWGQHEGTANISYIYAEAQKVVLEVKIVSIIIHCTHYLSSYWLGAYS